MRAVSSLRCLEVSVAELGAHADALMAIFRGELDLLVVREAITPTAALRVADALERRAGDFAWTPQQHPDGRPGQMMVMGMTLTPVSGFDLDLERYFTVAERFRRDCRELFAGEPDFEAAMIDRLGAMAGGRPVAIPEHDRGRAYTPATIRTLPHGCGIPVHCGNFFLETPGYRSLAAQLDTADQLSYFVTLRDAEEGGELEVYELQWGDPRTPMKGDFYDGERIAAHWHGLKVRPGPGDLLVFDGGRFYHRVTTVRGRTRVTIGGFVGFSPDHERALIWS